MIYILPYYDVPMSSYLAIDELHLRRSLMHIVEQTKDSNKLTLFLRPYVTTINHPSLDTFYHCIETGQNGIYMSIDNLVNNCLSNDELYLLIRKMIAYFTK